MFVARCVAHQTQTQLTLASMAGIATILLVALVSEILRAVSQSDETRQVHGTQTTSPAWVAAETNVFSVNNDDE
jgi:hypothetical protein